MPNTAEQAIYNRLASAPTFHPASAKLLPTDWTLEPGDVVTVKCGETSYSVPVYSMDLTWNANSQNGTCESATTRISVESTGGHTREPLPELQRKQFEQDRNAYTNFKAQKQEIDEHWQHVVDVTDQGMSDAFGIIGVSIGQDGMPVKDASGNYVWDDSGTGGEIWGHLNRSAWSTQILNHIKDSNGNIISLAEVYTDAYGNAIINAINDQRTGTATINANRIKLQATDSITLDSIFVFDNGALRVRKEAIFGETGNLITINNGKISADTLQVNSGGSLKFGDGTGTPSGYKTINATTAGNIVTGFGTPTESSGQISIPYYTVGIPSGSGSSAGNINFNIAATQYFIDSVAAARNVSSISGVSLSSSDLGHATNHSVTVTNNDGSTASASIDIYAPSGGSSSITAQNINLANSYDIFEVAADATSYDGNNLVYLANLSAAISQSRTGAVAFRATIDDVSGAGYKYYKVKRL